MAIRKAVFAGSWYPKTASACEQQIKAFLSETPDSPPEISADTSGEAHPGIPDSSSPLGVIVPHAGWTFSGGIACRTIARLNRTPSPDTVIVFGMHLPPQALPHIMTAGGLETPLGMLPVDEELAASLTAAFTFQQEDPRYFSPDNTIELQLPFIKYFFRNAAVVPVGVPAAPAAVEIGRLAVKAAGQAGKRLAVIGSTDLTHYGPNFGLTHYGLGDQAHEKVREKEDRRIIERILTMDPLPVIDESLSSHNACCAGAVAAAMSAAGTLGATSAILAEYATSYDKSPGESFVGYAGIVMFDKTIRSFETHL